MNGERLLETSQFTWWIGQIFLVTLYLESPLDLVASSISQPRYHISFSNTIVARYKPGSLALTWMALGRDGWSEVAEVVPTGDYR